MCEIQPRSDNYFIYKNKILQKLQLEIEANDAKFEEELPQRYHDNMQMRLLDIQHLIDDVILDDDVIVVSVEELVERWTVVRNQFKPRLGSKYVKQLF